MLQTNNNLIDGILSGSACHVMIEPMISNRDVGGTRIQETGI